MSEADIFSLSQAFVLGTEIIFLMWRLFLASKFSDSVIEE